MDKFVVDNQVRQHIESIILPVSKDLTDMRKTFSLVQYNQKSDRALIEEISHRFKKVEAFSAKTS